ncbi:hypothetical protein RGQ29_032120 [Quercus rubra]|uniref:Uncharacterized protein n=1 Tax=Quercus rubra TaxID=3512 RepID=A0AAN7DW02_QUERU|nr:hypothetical protein RGQ29_032120 [Quercus rubra]
MIRYLFDILIRNNLNDFVGNPIINNLIWLSKEIPAWSSTELPWSCPGDSKMQNTHLQQHLCQSPSITANKTIVNHYVKQCNWLLCVSFHKLDSPAYDLIPGIILVGQLLLGSQLSNYVGSFWPQNSTCLSWLDKQPVGSVICVTFGSLVTFSQQQFNELALDITDGALVEFLLVFGTSLNDHGMIVEWAPQEKVLDHPSIACFLSHCGWNSTLEGISRGVQFLCWPFFTDQLHNRSYICDVWKMETPLSNDGVKTNALKLKKMAKMGVTQGGSSFKNFESFIEQLKH